MNVRYEDIPEKFSEFVEKYQGNFEKKKYFKINKNLEVMEKEPSWLLELSLVYYGTKDTKVLGLINSEFEKCYKDKVKKIDRLSKYSISQLSEKFWRALMNKDGVHTIRLGNELYLRDSGLFLEMVYKYSFISSDINKLIKVFLFEVLCEKTAYHIEFIKNLLNYFSSSELEYIRYDSPEYMEYFNKYRADRLYEEIYKKKQEKYSMKSLELSPGSELGIEKTIIYEYLKKEGYL
jgi:hypothetical protein